MVAKAPLLRIEIVKRNDDTKGLVCNMSGTRYPGRTAAVGSVKRPSAVRAATTGLRRFQTFPPPPRNGDVRLVADPLNLRPIRRLVFDEAVLSA